MAEGGWNSPPSLKIKRLDLKRPILALQCDLSPWAVTRDEVDRFSKENGFSGWVETSVKENKNINESMR